MDMCLENIIGITNISPVFRENQFLNWFRRIVLNQFNMQLPENTVLSTEGILVDFLYFGLSVVRISDVGSNRSLVFRRIFTGTPTT